MNVCLFSVLIINRPEGRAHLFREMDYTDVKEAALVQDPSSQAGGPALDSSVRPTRRLPETPALQAHTALPPRGPLDRPGRSDFSKVQSCPAPGNKCPNICIPLWAVNYFFYFSKNTSLTAFSYPSQHLTQL